MRPFSGTGGWSLRLRALRRPEQQLNDAEVEQEKVNKVLAKEDARYDAMTEEEREKYYVKPGPLTRFKKFFRGQ